MDFSAQSNISFITQKIDDLEKITDQDNPYTRIVFSKKFYEARSWLKNEYQKLGLIVSTDDAGNLVGLLKSKTNICLWKLHTGMMLCRKVRSLVRRTPKF